MSDAEVDYSRVWQDTIRHLDDEGVAPRQLAFLGISQLVGVLQNLAIIVTPNSMTKGVIEDQIGSAVRQALSDQLGVEIAQLSVSVNEKLGDDFPPPLTDDTGSDAPDQRKRPDERAPRHGRHPARPGTAGHVAYRLRPRGRLPRRQPGRATPGVPGDPGPRDPGTPRAQPAQPEVHLRHLRRGLEQPVRARGRASPSPRGRRGPTTRCSSTATPVWARPTCCTRSASTRASCCPTCGCAT